LTSIGKIFPVNEKCSLGHQGVLERIVIDLYWERKRNSQVVLDQYSFRTLANGVFIWSNKNIALKSSNLENLDLTESETAVIL
jgi:hypothetical protein